MDSLVGYKIDSDFNTNKYNYFFTLLSNRFEIVNNHLVELLEIEFNKKFKPIYILQAKPNRYFEKENYIILNEGLKILQQKTNIKNLIYTQEYEDLNIEFANSDFVKKITSKLAKKQDKIFLISFTSYGLNNLNPKIINIGPKASVVNKYENKIEQIKLFKDLKLLINETKIYKNIEHLLNDKKKKFPRYVSASYTSGGYEAAVAFSKKEILELKKRMRPCNKKNKVFSAKLIEKVELSPNGTAIVIGRNKTIPLMVNDQILRGNGYIGSIYPSKASNKNQKIVINTLIQIGNYLSQEGFRGLFGCDYIIDDNDNCFIVDLNTRRQGGYLMLNLMSKRIDILDLELKLALNQRIPKFYYNDVQCNYVWAGSKIHPHSLYVKLLKEFKNFSEKKAFYNGKVFKCLYFPKNYTFTGGVCGYYLISGKDYDKVFNKLKFETEKIIKECCKKRDIKIPLYAD